MKVLVVSGITLLLLIGIGIAIADSGGDNDCDNLPLGWQQACEKVEKKTQENINRVLVFAGLPAVGTTLVIVRKLL